MTEQSPAVSSRAPAVRGLAAIAALIIAAVTAIEPATKAAEGEELAADLDAGKVPTICRGHTGPELYLGMKATPAQCAAWYR
jgi:hypothetical protein